MAIRPPPGKEDTDNRVLVAIVLSLAVFWAYTWLFPPVGADGLGVDGAPAAEVVQVDAGAAGVPAGSDPSTASPAGVPQGVVGGSEAEPPLPRQDLDFRSNGVQAVITSEGGALTLVQLPGYREAYQVDPLWRHLWDRITGAATQRPWRPWGPEPGIESVVTDQGLLLTSTVGGEADAGRYALEALPGGAVRALRRAGDVEIAKVFKPTGVPHLVDAEVRFKNVGATTLHLPATIGVLDRFPEDAGQYANVERPVVRVNGKVHTLTELADVEAGPEAVEGPVQWFGVADRYFLAAVVPADPAWGSASFAAYGSGRQGAFLARDLTLAPGEEASLRAQVYLGSKDVRLLREAHPDLPAAVDFGIFGFFAQILLWFLHILYGAVGNWGWAIILLTLVVKGIFYPLSQRSFVSGQKMQALSPLLTELREKHKDDPEAAGRAQMQLFQEHGVNPLSGCLPMLVQMPVWFALYSVLLSTADVYHASFFYLQDLSSPDPLGILPTVVGVVMMIQQALTPMSPGMDPAQQRILKLMPLLFVAVMYTFPSGLALYILVNTVLSILQMWAVRRAYPMPAPLPAAGA